MAPNRKIYALKRIKLQGRDAEAAAGFIDEITLLQALRGKQNIIQLVDAEVRLLPCSCCVAGHSPCVCIEARPLLGNVDFVSHHADQQQPSFLPSKGPKRPPLLLWHAIRTLCMSIWAVTRRRTVGQLLCDVRRLSRPMG